MTPAAEIKALRAALRLTQQALAEALGYHGKQAGRTVSRWETGVVPVPETALLLARTLVKP